MRAFSEEASAKPVKVGAADLELERGLREVDKPRIELLEDLLEKQVGEAFGDLLFLIAQSSEPLSLGRGLSSAFATLKPPQPLDQGTVPTATSLVPF